MTESWLTRQMFGIRDLNVVFIIAMPRSGSTLLFDLLRAHERVSTWGDEAYPPWVAVDPDVATGELGDAFRPGTVTDQAGVRAAALLANGVDDEDTRLGRGHTFRRLRRMRGARARVSRRPIVEKTPANVIRVAALRTLFRAPRFIFLTRDAPANIASMLEGREKGLAVRGWPAQRGLEWHFLMPPGWMEHVNDAPAEQFAWQWLVGNQTASDDLAGHPYVHVRYEQLVAEPELELGRILRELGLAHSPAVAAAARQMTPSKHTLSAPRDDKWRDREAEIAPVLPALADLRRALGYEAD